MASPLSPDRLKAALKKYDIDYELWPGWSTRGRPGGVDVKGFMIHHTAGGYSTSDSYMRFLFETGRPSEGIPGPLCNFAIDGNGKVLVGALGRSNNAGSGSSSTLSKIRGENYSGYSSQISPGSDNINGNSYYWGVEICYGGSGATQIRSAQYKAAVKLSAAIMDAYGWTALSVLGHKEHSRRKSDPGSFTMDKFRRDVRDAMQGNGDWFDMADKADLAEVVDDRIDANLNKIARAVWGRQFFTVADKTVMDVLKEARDNAIEASNVATKRIMCEDGIERLPRSLWKYTYDNLRNVERQLVQDIALEDGSELGPRSLWKWAFEHARDARVALDELKPLLEAAAEGRPLTAEQVQEIATACANAIPEDIATDVVDELKERL